MRGVSDNDYAARDGGPPTGSTAMWYWIVVMMFLFMAVVIVFAIIQTQAQ
jgi:hypothetical protein